MRLSADAAEDFQETTSQLFAEFGIKIVCFVTARSYGARCVIQWFFKDGELLNQTLIRVKNNSPFHHTYLHEVLLSQRQLARRLKDVMHASSPPEGVENPEPEGVENPENSQEIPEAETLEESLRLVLPEDF